MWYPTWKRIRAMFSAMLGLKAKTSIEEPCEVYLPPRDRAEEDRKYARILQRYNKLERDWERLKQPPTTPHHSER